MINFQERNEARGFLHRRSSFLRRVGAGLLGGGAVGAVGGAIGAMDAAARGAMPAGGRPCPSGFSGDGRGNCVPNPTPRPMSTAVTRVDPGVIARIQRFIPGGATGRSAAVTYPTEAVMGRYGPALVPGSMLVDRAVCTGPGLRGLVLGNDGLCYNKRDISNSEREWPRGPRPLGTAEEMRALRIASRFAGRMDRTNERLQSVGLLKKPTKSRTKKKNPKH